MKMEGQSAMKVKVTSQEEGHFDISHMHVQVLRSTFWLLALAVTILVIFSSVALLRNPSNRPIVNVFLETSPSDVNSDQSERLKRGAEIPDNHAHVHLKRELLFEGKRSGQVLAGGKKSSIAVHEKKKNIHKMKNNGTNAENRNKMQHKKKKGHLLSNAKIDLKDNQGPNANRTKNEKRERKGQFIGKDKSKRTEKSN